MIENETMDKRNCTIGIRVTPELVATLKALAASEDTTVSTIGYNLLLEYVAERKRRYLQLRQVFVDNQGLPCDTVVSRSADDDR